MLRDKNTDADGLCDDERIYYLGDANFNVTTLVNTGGDAVERYVYSPYGVLTIYDATWSNIRSASSYANVYTYTGRQLDTETGLYYYRARFYAAQLGRFIRRDPLKYADGLNQNEALFAEKGGVDPFGCTRGSIFINIFIRRHAAINVADGLEIWRSLFDGRHGGHDNR